MPDPSSHIDNDFDIGVISDTHGLLRPEALAALAGTKHILHAGDVGDRKVLDALRQIAPLTAIRGNIDTSGACSTLPLTEMVELAGSLFYMVHAIGDLDINPQAAGVAAVVFGHSHRALVELRNGVLFLNPGSAGPGRFSLPATVARVRRGSSGLDARIIPIR